MSELKKMVFRQPNPAIWYPDDVVDLVRIAADRGYELQPIDAQAAWSEFSESHSAGWLILGACCEGDDSDEGIWQAMLPYLREIES